MSESNVEVQKDGMRWFVGALIVAVAFSAWLRHADDSLMNSTREKELGSTLRELRGAQTSIPSNVSDARQVFEPLEMQQEAASETHAEVPTEPSH